MEDEWREDQLARLLREAMVSRAHDVDPERARDLARRAKPLPHRWPVVTSAAAAVALVCTVVVILGGRGPDGAGGPVTGPSAAVQSAKTAGAAREQRTTEDNRRRAVAASEAALAGLPVPVGSVRLGGQPSGWPPGRMGLGPSDFSLTRTSWWSVPMSLRDVASFFTTHAPDGMEHPTGEDVIGSGNGDGVDYTTYIVIEPADPAAYSGLALLVQFKQFGEHTVLRADTFLAARFAVPEEVRITGDVTTVRIDRRSPGSPSHSVRSGAVSSAELTSPQDAAQITRLVDEFNGLYGGLTERGAISCPFAPPRRVTVTFSVLAGTDQAATVVAEQDLGCWSQIHVTLDGTPLRLTLEPSARWDNLVDEIADSAPVSTSDETGPP